MRNHKKMAFTLVELLIVVIVLGVLAGVAVPKFKRVLDSRKTTEAENMLAAVRTEQEKRCIMGKRYFGQGKENQVEVLANASNSQNYTYELSETGIKAEAVKGGYTLKMLSYKDGRICCSGTGCAALNKNYVSCDTITLSADECSAAVDEPGSEPEPESPTTCVPYSWTSSSEIGSGDSWGTCYITHHVTCNDSNEEEEHVTPDGCVCRNGNYEYNESTKSCEPKEEEETCTPKLEYKGSAGGMADTCNGDNTNQYTCDGKFKGTCTDVFGTVTAALNSSAENASWWLPSDSFASFQQGILLAQSTAVSMTNGNVSAMTQTGSYSTTSGSSTCKGYGQGYFACTQHGKTVCCPPTYTCEDKNLSPYCAKGSTPAGNPSLFTQDDLTRIGDVVTPGHIEWPDRPVRPDFPAGGIEDLIIKPTTSLYSYRTVTCCGNGDDPDNPNNPNNPPDNPDDPTPEPACQEGAVSSEPSGNSCGTYCGVEYIVKRCVERTWQTESVCLEGVCSPGEKRTVHCPTGSSTRTDTCNSSCKWDYGSCPSSSSGGGGGGGGGGGCTHLKNGKIVNDCVNLKVNDMPASPTGGSGYSFYERDGHWGLVDSSGNEIAGGLVNPNSLP